MNWIKVGNRYINMDNVTDVRITDRYIEFAFTCSGSDEQIYLDYKLVDKKENANGTSYLIKADFELLVEQIQHYFEHVNTYVL